jgi:hypothetical protein
MATYLDMVQDVMIRMRESKPSSVYDTGYTQLIGKFVNDAKRMVENAYDWNSIKTSILITTSPGVYAYTLNGTNNRFTMIDVIDTTTRYILQNYPIQELNKLYLIAQPPQSGSPVYYGFNGIDGNGNTIVNLYPVPNSTDNIYFNLTLPQADLYNDTDVITIPSPPVVQLAYGMAIAERGEDGSIGESDAIGLGKAMLADYIAIENSRYMEDQVWVAT